MSRAFLLVPLVLTTAVLGGCGGDDEPKATPSPSSSEFVETTPPTASPSPTATRTGPSGDTPAERRDDLGGCPSAAEIESLGGATVIAAEDPGPTTVCSYASERTTEYQGGTSPVLAVYASEPVGLHSADDLRDYRRTVQRSNPVANAALLGDGAFYSYFEDSPALCAVWFLAKDDHVLTVSTVDLVGDPGPAGPSSAACTLAGRVAAGFRS